MPRHLMTTPGYQLASLSDVVDVRERLLRRVEAEARALANSDATAAQLRLGRVYALLEAGGIAGYWRVGDSARRLP